MAPSSTTWSEGAPQRTDTVKSGAAIFLMSTSTMASRAIRRRSAPRSDQSLQAFLQSLDVALQPLGQCLVEECRANDSRQHLMDIGQALQRIRQRGFVDV